jgi:hypothetical protein
LVKGWWRRRRRKKRRLELHVVRLNPARVGWKVFFKKNKKKKIHVNYIRIKKFVGHCLETSRISNLFRLLQNS